jgi:lysophospholipase L1-like esterase
MTKLVPTLLLSVALLSPLRSVVAAENPPPAAVQFRDSELVLFLGDGYLEGEIGTGHLEAYLTQANASKKLTFRNLSWSGDTPLGESRSYFGPPEEGYQRLKKHLDEIQPTLVFLNYGAAAAGDAKMTAANFGAGYKRVIDTLQALPSKPHIVLLSPLPRQEVGRAHEALAALNLRVAEFGKVSADLAEKSGLRYLDLSKVVDAFRTSKDAKLTANGSVLTADGQRLLAPLVAGVVLGKAPQSPPAPALVTSILRKNELFFNRTRPANEIYLFGSRKHEQGNNAAEIPQFDPLIAAAEADIEKAKSVPLP